MNVAPLHASMEGIVLMARMVTAAPVQKGSQVHFFLF